jgi:hypothetical protein
MQLFKKFKYSAITALFAFVATAPLAAQQAPLGAGGGVVFQDGVNRIYAFNCHDLGGGAATGKLVSLEPGSQGRVGMNISSAMHIGSWLAIAGEITVSVNTPPHIGVGQTMFMVAIDNGTGPDQIATGVVPAALGNLTIQEIVAMIGPPPPVAFSSFVAGGVTIF